MRLLRYRVILVGLVVLALLLLVLVGEVAGEVPKVVGMIAADAEANVTRVVEHKGRLVAPVHEARR